MQNILFILPRIMTIAIYFDQPGIMSYPFDNPLYLESYKAFATLAEKQEVAVHFSRGADTYSGNMRFTSYYAFQNGELIFVPQPYQADSIFLKGYSIKVSPTDHVLNNPTLGNICRNKLETYHLFREYMAPTYEITTENYQSVLDHLVTELVVIKPIYGSEGKGIQVLKKNTFHPDLLDKNVRYFAQQFVDSSGGIPGILTGLHDMRIILFNNTVKNSFIRQPKEGSFLANIAQGGSFTHLPVDKIPASAMELVRQIDAHFTHYTPRFYAVDLMYEQEKPYLVELNDQPGMPFMSEDQYNNSATRFHQDLLDLLTKK